MPGEPLQPMRLRCRREAAADDAGIADSGDRGDAVIDGSALGQMFSRHGGIGVVNGSQAGSGEPPSLVTVTVPANFDLTCEQLSQDTRTNVTRPNEAVLVLYVSAAPASLVTGTYVVTAGMMGAMTAQGYYSATDSNCTRNSEEWAAGSPIPGRRSASCAGS